MEAREILSLGQKPRSARPYTSSPDLLFMEVAEQPQQIRALVVRGRKPKQKVDAQERCTMRDLVLGAFLGPQFYREDDGKYVAPYTSENTRDSRPVGLTKDDLKMPGAVDMKRTTTRVQASETRPKKKGAIPLGPLAFQDAHIVREVGSLATEHGQWLRYAYADSKEWSDEAGLVVALWHRSEPLLGKIQAKTRKSAQALAHLAVQNFRSLVNSGRTVHPAYRLRELLGVSESNWDQHWAKRWQLLQDQLHQLDREALTALNARLSGFEFVLLDRGI